MREIIINGRFVGKPVTGVERYAIEITRALDRLLGTCHPLTDDMRFTLIVPRGATPSFQVDHINVVNYGRLQGHTWEQIDLAFAAKNRTILNLCNFGPVLSAKNVTCVHDAHVWLIPENFSWKFNLLYKTLLPITIRRSKAWVTVSKFSGKMLREFGVAPRQEDATTYNGGDHVDDWRPGSSTINRAALPKVYVLALGSRSKNKNFEHVLAVAKAIYPLGIQTVVVGGNNSKVFGESVAEIGPEIVQLGRLSDNDICFLMRNATCFLFPSLFEGFGLPPIEAMKNGCPVIASNTSAMPEVLGEAALLRDPRSVTDWVEAVKKITLNPQLRDELIRKGFEQAGKYRWESSALTLLKIIKRQ
ncbi:glycosyltransferase family 4 protein [Paraburkholderia sediminicola]|uniref:glycosyltransferase family 4 protein n=1 Tax=Paraburkholderia sediminicola TaxID=458836 RepID=UPI0038B7EF2C